MHALLAHAFAWSKTMKNIQKSWKLSHSFSSWALHESLIRMIVKVFFSWFSNVFHCFRPCECMQKHAFAGWNTQRKFAHLFMLSLHFTWFWLNSFPIVAPGLNCRHTKELCSVCCVLDLIAIQFGFTYYCCCCCYCGSSHLATLPKWASGNEQPDNKNI